MSFARSFRVLSLFAAVVIFASVSIAAAASDDIAIRFLSGNKRVIALTYEEGGYVATNVKIPDIAVSNDTPGAIEIISVDLEGKSRGDVLIKKVYSARVVKKNMSEFGDKINKLRTGKFPMGLVLAFGKVVDPGRDFAVSNILKPGDTGALSLWQDSWFEYTGAERVDELEFKVYYRGAERSGMRRFSAAIEEYRQKNRYSFPVKGNVYIANMSANYCHHRITNSQEFGMDILVLNDKLAVYKKTVPDKLADSYSYRRDIHAAADGTVVSVAGLFPEHVSELSEAKNLKTNMLALAEKIGFENAVGGNHVVIDHGNGEYGFYAHLSEGTIAVAPGDFVKKGQVIAKLGSTGNSDGPHLHFQIMDSPDLVSANGLPVSFEDIPAAELCSYRKSYNALGNCDVLKIRIE